MTAAERLRLLAGAGGTAAALLLSIGVGATTGEALTTYSGLPTATAAEHLLADRVPSGVSADDSTDEEAHLAVRQAYAAKLYAPTPVISHDIPGQPDATPVISTDIPGQPDVAPVISADTTGQADDQAKRDAMAALRRKDDEEALLLILAQILD